MPQRKKHSSNPLQHLPEISDTVSYQECTGLMPTPPRTPEQHEAYRKLFTMELPGIDFEQKQ